MISMKPSTLSPTDVDPSGMASLLVFFFPLMNLMSQLCFSVELEVWNPDYYQHFQLPILPLAFLKGSIEKEVMIKALGTGKV